MMLSVSQKTKRPSRSISDFTWKRFDKPPPRMKTWSSHGGEDFDVASAGLHPHVVLYLDTNVSEERNASILKVQDEDHVISSGRKPCREVWTRNLLRTTQKWLNSDVHCKLVVTHSSLQN
jgi:hypothetical protein